MLGLLARAGALLLRHSYDTRERYRVLPIHTSPQDGGGAATAVAAALMAVVGFSDGRSSVTLFQCQIHMFKGTGRCAGDKYLLLAVMSLVTLL